MWDSGSIHSLIQPGEAGRLLRCMRGFPPAADRARAVPGVLEKKRPLHPTCAFGDRGS
jgi:hypothetical protein